MSSDPSEVHDLPATDINFTDDIERLCGELTPSDAIAFLMYAAQQRPGDEVARASITRQRDFAERLIDLMSRRVVRRMNMVNDTIPSTSVLRNYWRHSASAPLSTSLREPLSQIPVRHSCTHYELRRTRWGDRDQDRARGYLAAGSRCSQCSPHGRSNQPHYDTLAQAQAAAQ